MITPRPSPDDSTPKPGFPMRPFFGIDPVLVDDKVCMFKRRVLNNEVDLPYLFLLFYNLGSRTDWFQRYW